MPQREHFDVLVLGSGQGGQQIGWHLAQAGRRAALVERRWIGGSCPTIACMPSKTELWSARVAHLARHGQPFGVTTGGITIDMPTVLRHKRDMVRHEVELHMQNFTAASDNFGNGTTPPLSVDRQRRSRTWRKIPATYRATN
jgi:pyruvate/2-oxoglutarate dehydrogenase complex dihydrolipoamide dehydrogenase (E3) component